MKNELTFCPLGGSGEIGMNMNLYAFGTEENKKWITQIEHMHLQNGLT